MLAQIIDLVAKAQRSRAPVQHLADRVASWFVPLVLLVSIFTFVAWLAIGPTPRFSHALTNAVAVLIIACPCALGLATPMAIAVGMGRGARDGILFRDAEAIEQLGQVDLLFVDKTGTLTEGSAKVAQCIETHIDCFAPGGYGQRHGHMNSAVFYVLKGRGYDVHDRRRLDWEAGDALIVENSCVHQHPNDDPNEEAIVLVAKAKPLFLFMHLIFQKIAAWPPKEPESQAQRDYVPPAEL